MKLSRGIPHVWLVVLLCACTDSGDSSDIEMARDTTGWNYADITQSNPPQSLATDQGAPAVVVVIPETSGPALQLAAQDLTAGIAAIIGSQDPPASDAPWVVKATVDPAFASLTAEGYRFFHTSDGLYVSCYTEQGCAYGLWHVAHALGIRWIHPEEAPFVPTNPDAVLPQLPQTPITPRFRLRGFHEHTQHPIPMSDYLLRPGSTDFEQRLERYAQWLARNRQNVLFFHLLKTVDLDTWIPYMAHFTEIAKGLGVQVGAFVSFADQQQNNFKLISDAPAETEEPPDPEVQIISGLDKVLQSGISLIGFQFGTSEFTKPTDEVAIGWLNTATSHLRTNHPTVEAFAWIHITCSLESETSGKFFHLPQKADTDLGAFVHTTMFYTAFHPAPVYDCEDFSHQVDFMKQTNGTRTLVWFPETAWWLGFDNNVPLALPITGWSRDYDILTILPEFDVDGHVTFTTGREWGYWQYDHYLTEVTWDGVTRWEDYLVSLTPLFGSLGPQLVQALQSVTDLQVELLYEDNPLLMFYLSGELPQDEIGAQAGILARQPKLPFQDVVQFSDAELAEWMVSDLDPLRSFRDALAAIIQPLPPRLNDGTPQQQKWYRESYTSLHLLVLRASHAITLYEGVMSARSGDKQQAEAHLDNAQTITAEALALIAEVEADYRDPIEILARPKPDTLTSYPYGYLWETSTAFFWTRRDDQLMTLIADLFNPQPQLWSADVSQVFATIAEKTTLLEPDNPVANAVLAGFVPPLLLGIADFNSETNRLTVILGQDHDKNGLPLSDLQTPFVGVISDRGFTANASEWTVDIRDQAGQSIGTLVILEPELKTNLVADANVTPWVWSATTAEIGGNILTENLLTLIMAVGGIDEEGASNLVASVYGVEALPDLLPMRFGFELQLQP